MQMAAKNTYDQTSKAERKRVDGIKTPRPKWFNCKELAFGAQCTTVNLPLDYDKPRGATVSRRQTSRSALEPCS